METKWEAKNFHKNFHDVLERGVEVEIKRHTTYFREQIELWVGPKKEVENPWTSPNKVYFSSRWPPLGARKSAPKKLKNNFLQYTWKLEEVQNLEFLLILFSQIFPDAVKYELTNICILYTDPQLITLLRSTAAQKKFLYYPVIGLRFWTLNFHQQGQGFHSVREVREFARGSEKVREIWNFFEKVGKSQRRKFLSMQIFNFKKNVQLNCIWQSIVYNAIICI